MISSNLTGIGSVSELQQSGFQWPADHPYFAVSSTNVYCEPGMGAYLHRQHAPMKGSYPSPPFLAPSLSPTHPAHMLYSLFFVNLAWVTWPLMQSPKQTRWGASLARLFPWPASLILPGTSSCSGLITNFSQFWSLFSILLYQLDHTGTLAHPLQSGFSIYNTDVKFLLKTGMFQSKTFEENVKQIIVQVVYRESKNNRRRLWIEYILWKS